MNKKERQLKASHAVSLCAALGVLKKKQNIGLTNSISTIYD